MYCDVEQYEREVYNVKKHCYITSVVSKLRFQIKPVNVTKCMTLKLAARAIL